MLTDRSVTVQRDSSAALGQGCRLGFLGTLHMDVFRQRLEDEYDSNVIITAPTVPYKSMKLVLSHPPEFTALTRRSSCLHGWSGTNNQQSYRIPRDDRYRREGKRSPRADGESNNHRTRG